MLLNPKQSCKLILHALENQYGVLAVNADSHAAVTDCLEAAAANDSPIIIETILWQLEGYSYGAGDAVLGLGRYLADTALLAQHPRYADVPVLLHTDHIKGPKTLDILQNAIKGITLSWDGASLKLCASTISLDAADFSEEQNIETICSLTEFAKKTNSDLTLEMEAGVDAGLTPEDVTRRLIGSVEKRYPGYIGLYAPGLGTKHGFSADGYPEFSTEAVQKNIRLLQEITGRKIGIALHGSSGLSNDKLEAAAKSGVVKVNWSTESLMIRSAAAMQYYQTHTEQFDKKHPQWKNTVMDNGVQRFVSQSYIPRVTERMQVLGSKGKAKAFLQTL